MDNFSNYVGRPELAFTSEYKDLRNLRDVYFERLTERINHKEVFKFFKWFDSSLGDIIQTLVPSKTVFFGTNYVVESHLLERAKYDYKFEEVYLNPTDRPNLRGKIGLSLFSADVKKL